MSKFSYFVLHGGNVHHASFYILKTGELLCRKTDRASQFIGNSLKNSVVLESLTFPPRAGVLVPKTQIFSWRHLPISLVFAYGIGGQDIEYLTRKSWGFVIHPKFVFTK